MKPSRFLFLALFVFWGVLAASKGDAWMALLWGLPAGAESCNIVRHLTEWHSGR